METQKGPTFVEPSLFAADQIRFDSVPLGILMLLQYNSFRIPVYVRCSF